MVDKELDLWELYLKLFGRASVWFLFSLVKGHFLVVDHEIKLRSHSTINAEIPNSSPINEVLLENLPINPET